MLLHPAIAFKNKVSVFAYQDLCRLYAELDVVYWLDLPFTQGRIRLTNVETGEYIIYGDLAVHGTEHDVGEDESLGLIMPEGMMRVATGEYESFDTFKISSNLQYLACQGNWGILFELEGDIVIYDVVRVNQGDINSARLCQHSVMFDRLKAQKREAEVAHA